jgi:hypothetical protein
MRQERSVPGPGPARLSLAGLQDPGRNGPGQAAIPSQFQDRDKFLVFRSVPVSRLHGSGI